MADVALIPKRGKLTARVFENARVGIPPTLFFDIEIPLQPFEFEGEVVETAVWLEFINFRTEDWRSLPGREFRFPRNPDDGYIDGSIYLGGFHNPADTTRIQFVALDGTTLPATLDIEFDFTFEGLSRLGRIPVTWQVELGLGPVELDKAVAEAAKAAKKRKR